MKALVLTEVKQSLTLQSVKDPEPGPGDVCVQLQAAALNRRDYWITQGLYPGIRTPVVLGSDGAGTVVAAGSEVPAELVGREVLINPGLDWGERRAAQESTFRILGMPDDGTFAERVVVPAAQVAPRPAHLDAPKGAALPLAGVTAYRALVTQGAVRPSDTVLVTGVGGGVATFLLQFARAVGAKVLVTSSSEEKMERALALGAAAAFNYRDEGWAESLREAHGLVDLVVDGAGGEGHPKLVELASPGGRIVHYGATAGPPDRLDLRKVFWKQLRIIGSTMGSPDDFRDLLAFVEEHRIEPIVDGVVPLAEGAAAVEAMARSPQFGKVVLRVDPPSTP